MAELSNVEDAVPVDNLVVSDTNNLVERSTVPGRKRWLWKIGIVLAGLLLFSCVIAVVVTTIFSSSSGDSDPENANIIASNSGSDGVLNVDHHTQTFAGQVILIAPVNTAAEYGSSARLNCTADLAMPGGGLDVLQWTHFITEPTGTRIVISSAPDDIHEEGFSLDYDAGEGRYDLIIDMSKDLGGNYMCYLMIADIKAQAEVVALANVGCSRRNDGRDVVEGQAVALDCEVSYRGYKQPSLEWASDEIGILQGNYVEDEENPEKIFYVANVTAQAGHDRMEFTCDLAFERDDGEEEEPPHYRSTCSTSFQVLHGATDIVIDPNPADYPDCVIEITVGSEIKCSAGGNPDPHIYWQAEEDGTIIESSSLLIEEWMTEVEEETLDYKCVARNTINMVEYKVEKLVTFNAGHTQEVQRPENIAAAVGDAFSLNCVIPDTYALEWHDEFGNNIAINGDIGDDDYTVVYDVDSYNSTITAVNNIDMTKGKRHMCAATVLGVGRVEGHAQVIMLESSTPNCMAEENTVVEDDEIEFSCEMAYNGLWAPVLSFQWEEDGPEFNTTIETNETLGLAKSTVHITASVDMSPVAVMQCTGMFQDITDVPPDHAENTPEFDFDTCTMQITVHVPITEDRISFTAENGSSLYEGTPVTCSADDINPAADSIVWTDEEGGVVDSDQGTFLVGVTGDYVYTCTITNTVGSDSRREGNEISASNSLWFTSFATTVNPTTEELTTTSSDTTTVNPTTTEELTTTSSDNGREPPVYDTKLFGNFTSFPDGDFDFDCTNRYSNELRDRAAGMIPVVNTKLGTELCTRHGPEDFTMMSVSTILTTTGPNGETNLSFKTVVDSNLRIDDVYECMAEVSFFLRDHDNWGLPLLPQLPGCPFPLFDPPVFYSTGDKWFCISTSQETAPTVPGYELDIASNFTTLNEQDLSSQCAGEYSNDLMEKVAVMQFTLNNEQLGSHLCSGVSITVITSTSSLVYQGPQGISSVQFIMQSADHHRFTDLFSCADEVMEYLFDHANWGLPLLPQRPGCPFLVFHEQRFYEEGQRWICLP